MKALIAFIAVMGCLIGCSMLKDVGTSVLKSAVGGSGGGVSLEAQVGDNETETSLQSEGARGTGDVVAKDNAKVEVNTSQVESQIQSADKVEITNQDIAPWYLITSITAMLLFWVLPTPASMLAWFIGLFKKKGATRRKRH